MGAGEGHTRILHGVAGRSIGQQLTRRGDAGRHVGHAARGAASTLLRTGMDQDAARSAMLEEMRRRSRWLASRSANNELSAEEYQFVPDPQWKKPILLNIFLSSLLPVGFSYWTDRPGRSADALGQSKAAGKA